MFGKSLYWRETFRKPKFFFMDGRIAGLILIFVLHIKIWTLLLVLTAAGILWFFERKGVNPDDILRFLRAGIVGRRRTARGAAAERSFVDFGYETEGDVQMMASWIEASGKRHLARQEKSRGKAARTGKA